MFLYQIIVRWTTRGPCTLIVHIEYILFTFCQHKQIIYFHFTFHILKSTLFVFSKQSKINKIKIFVTHINPSQTENKRYQYMVNRSTTYPKCMHLKICKMKRKINHNWLKIEIEGQCLFTHWFQLFFLTHSLLLGCIILFCFIKYLKCITSLDYEKANKILSGGKKYTCMYVGRVLYVPVCIFARPFN